jgi:hypothetical protein
VVLLGLLKLKSVMLFRGQFGELAKAMRVSSDKGGMAEKLGVFGKTLLLAECLNVGNNSFFVMFLRASTSSSFYDL